VVWVVVEMRAGVRADETGAGGDILAPAEMVWWYAGVGVGGVAIARALRATAGASPGTGRVFGALAALVGFLLIGTGILGMLPFVLLLPVALIWAVKRRKARSPA
jgi:hypothetical protein